MHEAIADFAVSVPLIGIDRRAVLDVLENLRLQGIALGIWNHFGPYFAEIAIQHSHYDGLSLRSRDHLVTRTLFLVHVLEIPADKSLIHFHRSAVIFPA